MNVKACLVNIDFYIQLNGFCKLTYREKKIQSEKQWRYQDIELEIIFISRCPSL